MATKLSFMSNKKVVAVMVVGFVSAFLITIAACRADPAPEVTPASTANVIVVPTRAAGEPVATVTTPADDVTQPTATSAPTTQPTAVPPTAVSCTPQRSWPTYIVQRGDTLGKIAQAAGSSVSELTQANCLSNPNLLEVGQTLYVPHAIVLAPTPTATVPADTWVAYADPHLQITYDYPAAWTRQQGGGGDTRFEGSNGFIYAMALSGGTDLETLTKNEAEHVLLPYGPNPTIEAITLSNGQEGRLILPSAAPTAGVQQQAAFLTPYPNPIVINGLKHNYLYIVADPAHIRRVAQSVKMPPIPGGIEVKFFTAEVVEVLPNGGRRLKFAWDSEGATYGQILSGTSQRFLNWWPVGPADTLTVDLANTIFPNPLMTLQLFNAITGEEALATVGIQWPCPYAYFFTPAPERCPTAAPQVATGAYQTFEHGWMVWRPDNSGNLIYAFLNSGDVYVFTDTWRDGDPISDPNIVPPNGREQPVRGFGKVWRENSFVRDGLGWATAAETTYTLKYQAEIRESLPSVSYLTRPQGDLLKLTETKWEVWSAVQSAQLPEVTVLEPLLTAVLYNDIDSKMALTQLLTEGCTTRLGLGGPPKCAEGQVEGTLVSYLPVMGPGHGEPVLPEQLPTLLNFTVESLEAIIAIGPQNQSAANWPLGEYALLFAAANEVVTVRVTDGKIVRLDFNSHMAADELANESNVILWLAEAATNQR